MIKGADRKALDLPFYDGLLAGHHGKEPGYACRRARGTDDWLLVATLSGEGRFGSRNGDIVVRPGSLALISPGTPHDYGPTRGAEIWEILWVHFQPPHSWLEFLHWPPAAPGIATFEPSASAWIEIERCFHELCRCSFTSSRRRLHMSMNCLERLLLLCDEQIPEASHSLDERVRLVIQHIHGHLRDPLSLESLSGLVHLSESRFSHLFRDEFGMAPQQYIAQQRLQRAATLLERTTHSIGEVAAEIGMEPFHFSAKFKAHTGVNPREYRRTRAALDAGAS